MTTQRQTNTAQRATNTKQGVTNENLFALIHGEVLPEIRAVKSELAELKKESGLNGHTALLKEFLDDRAMSVANRKRWLGRAKVAAAVVAFVSSIGWAILAFRQVVQIVHPG